jgi:hypothetical protein
MKKFLYLVLFATGISAVELDDSFSMQNEALSQEIEESYQSWKNEKKITPAIELKLKYNLTIIGPDIVESYTIDGRTMLQIKELFDKARSAREPNQWYVGQIDLISDNDYGIQEHTLAMVALTLNQMEKIANLIPQLKIDFDKTLNGNE